MAMKTVPPGLHGALVMDLARLGIQIDNNHPPDSTDPIFPGVLVQEKYWGDFLKKWNISSAVDLPWLAVGEFDNRRWWQVDSQGKIEVEVDGFNLSLVAFAVTAEGMRGRWGMQSFFEGRDVEGFFCAARQVARE